MQAPARPTSFLATRASVYLDALRGGAAFLVVIGHWRNAFYVDMGQVTQYRGAVLAVYSLTNLSHQAVIIFFALSGYLVGGGVVDAIRRAQWSWGRYLVHRLVRLWLVLLPALVLGYCWDTLGIRLHDAPLLYAGHGSSHLTQDVTANLSLPTLLGNAAFLQTIAVAPFGSNGALWSLADEWWYYILFPLAACLVARACRSTLSAGVHLIALVAVAYLVGGQILVLFPVWLCGALLHRIPVRKRRAGSVVLIGAALVYGLAVAGLAFIGHKGGAIAQNASIMAVLDNALGALTAAFLWLLMSDRRIAPASAATRLARGTARFSYTLYVTHLPLVIFCSSVLVNDSRWTPDGKHAAIGLAVLALVVLYGWLLAWLLEFRTDAVRSWIEMRLGVRSSRAGVAGSVTGTH